MARMIIPAVWVLLFTMCALAQNDEVYKSEEFLDRYGKKISAPPLNLSIDLSQMSLAELRYLRYMPLAWKGFLFTEADIRAYFQGKEWYQPVWWDDRMDFSLRPEEKAFVAQIDQRISAMQATNFIGTGEQRRANLGNVVNLAQFDSIPAVLAKKLAANGFALVPGQSDQLFYMYENNDYSLIPNFVTTDVFLQLYHMYFDFLLRKIEEERLSPALKQLSRGVLVEATRIAAAAKTPLIKQAAERVMVHSAVSLTLLDKGKMPKLPSRLAALAKTEVRKINAATGRGSQFLDAKLFDYTAFIPRGHYTRSEVLKRYFKAMLWLQKAPFMLDKDDGLAGALVFAHIIQSNESLRKHFSSIVEPLTFIAGDPDNLSLADALAVLKERGTEKTSFDALFTPTSLKALRSNLEARDPEQIRPKASVAVVRTEVARSRLLILAQRYSPDAEILQRIVNVDGPESEWRPFPKGLDVLATMGSKTATSILIDEIGETRTWPAYRDTLEVLQKQFTGYSKWNANIYNTWLHGITDLVRVDSRCQPFMHTDAWQRRCLNTALAAWTGLKHDFILYSKQAEVAECGGDEPPPPPLTVGYVEPAIDFWKQALTLMDQTSEVLGRYGWWTGDVKTVSTAIRETAEFLKSVSEKELRGERLLDQEYETIRLMGSTIDGLTLQVMDVMDWTDVEGADKSIAMVTDVFTNGDQVLQEGVGLGNSIYVLVEIDGLLYLTRGAVYSYYEFIGPSMDRLTDEKWQERLRNNQVPELPAWIRGILVPITPLESSEGSSYSSGC